MKPFHYNQDPLYTAAASILQAQQLTEDIVAFNNRGFKQLNGLMSDEDIHTAVNSTIKSATQKLSDSTWDVVTDIYGRRKNSTWAGDWILARKGGGAWLTIKDGGSFKAQDSIVDVLSFFEIEEEMENKEMKEGDEGFYSQKMIKNQLQTIVRNSNECLKMVEDDREFPEWAQSEIAVAEDGIVSVTEFMQSHNSDKEEIDEAPSSFKMGTATIIKSGHFMNGKQVDVFHKFDDGRINAQYRKNDSKGRMVHNMTLKPDEYKLDEASIASADQLATLSTVMRSMRASNQDINDVREELQSSDPSTSARFLVLLAETIGNDTAAFNAFVKAQSK